MACMDTRSALDEASIAHLIDRFYDKVRADPSLGVVFNPVVHDWSEHKKLLTSFWYSVVLHANSDQGSPMSAHRAQPAIRTEHFERWLALWRETMPEVLDETDVAK